MRIDACIGCGTFPCPDVNHAVYQVPPVEIDPEQVSIVLISEAAAANPADGYYAAGSPSFAETTLQMFRDAGESASSLDDLLELGVYCTTAVKCGKTAYALQRGTIQTCAKLLAQELALFPRVKAYLLMGDVAIKAMNFVAAGSGQPRVIPSGPTYKIRKGSYFFQGRRAFPSYLQVGPSFYIEKGKHLVVAEDIKAALVWVRQ